eukprot:c10812_g1_i2.p1 GENE.c10812_g1_i2~~c10812_g1_i2.p1  ORF type:complete len:739 (-),score=142.86 c10812_g1_i2:86-2302(-)
MYASRSSTHSSTSRARSLAWPVVVAILSLCYAAIIIFLVLRIDYIPKHKHAEVTRVSRHFATAGSVIGFLSCFAVATAYLFLGKKYRRHPNSMLFWRVVCDMFVAVRFFVDPVLHTFLTDESCRLSSMVLEFFELASEGWFLCVMVDLVLTLRNPFANYRRNLRIYHVVAWGMGVVSAVELVNARQYGLWPHVDGDTEIQWCWLRTHRTVSLHRANPYLWTFFAGPLFAIYSMALMALVYAMVVLRQGLAKTFTTRLAVLVSNMVNLIVYLIVWGLFSFAYWGFYFYQGSKVCKCLLLFVFSSKGFADLIVWIAITKIYCKDRLDDDLSPQANATLCEEMLHYITSGIIRATSRSPPDRSTAVWEVTLEEIVANRIAWTAVLRQLMWQHRRRVSLASTPARLKFVSYAPVPFASLRQLHGVTAEVIEASFSLAADPPMHMQFNEGGASGAIFLLSRDRRFIVKSCASSEAMFWIQRAKGAGSGNSNAQLFSEYLASERSSFITRIYGVFSLRMYTTTFYFVLMENRLPEDVPIHERYDIKGSWVKRHAQLPRDGHKVKCRHCNANYIYKREHPNTRRGSFASQRELLVDNHSCPFHTRHEPNIVFKDEDFNFKIQISDANTVIDQLTKDSNFLCDRLHTLDYSLLVGVSKTFVALPDDLGVNTTVQAHRAARVHGPALYFLSIIDLVQTWTLRKRLEWMFKALVLGRDPEGISSQPPRTYANRFQQAIRIHIVHGPPS